MMTIKDLISLLMIIVIQSPHLKIVLVLLQQMAMPVPIRRAFLTTETFSIQMEPPSARMKGERRCGPFLVAQDQMVSIGLQHSSFR